MTLITPYIRALPLSSQHRLTAVLVGFWMLSMISVPILRWTFGESVMPFSITLTVLSQVAAVLAALGSEWSKRRILLTLAGVILLGWSVEYLGSNTGFPFGTYDYTAILQPQLLGVPLLIPLAWFMMMPPAWAIAQTLGFAPNRLMFIICTSAAFTAWDLFLDPQMVGWGIWAWAEPVGYFGIPWVNFLGWLLCSALITAVVRPRAVPARPLLIIYIITWLFQTIGLAVFWGQPGPALVGFLVMGLFAAGAIRAELRAAS